jgi:mono/diheme cytochrome c family protein
LPALVGACAPQAGSLTEGQLELIEHLESLSQTTPDHLQEGKAIFERQCASCHGRAGGGLETGPPLVAPVYRPSHHSDFAFHLAVSQGVRAHHFRFGDMPSRPGVSQQDSEAIVAYVRWLQRGVGID